MKKTEQIKLLEKTNEFLELENAQLLEETLQQSMKLGELKRNAQAIYEAQRHQIKILIQQLEDIGAK